MGVNNISQHQIKIQDASDQKIKAQDARCSKNQPGQMNHTCLSCTINSEMLLFIKFF